MFSEVITIVCFFQPYLLVQMKIHVPSKTLRLPRWMQLPWGTDAAWRWHFETWALRPWLKRVFFCSCRWWSWWWGCWNYIFLLRKGISGNRHNVIPNLPEKQGDNAVAGLISRIFMDFWHGIRSQWFGAFLIRNHFFLQGKSWDIMGPIAKELYDVYIMLLKMYM